MSPEPDPVAGGQRIVIVVSSLALGGAERAAVNLANQLSEEGFEVSIVTFEPPGERTDLDINPRIAVLRLNLAQASRSVLAAVPANWRRVAVIRAAIQRAPPALVISFVHHTNVLVILACMRLNVPVIACEESEPSRSPTGMIWRGLRRVAYPLATGVVVHTKAARTWFSGWRNLRVHVIPNAVRVPTGLEVAASSARGPIVLSVGRLGREKGYDILLRAFAEASASMPEWSLVIVGEGRERGALEALARELRLAGRVTMPGVAKDPWRHYRDAAIFVSSSRHEGFGIALCEAMAAGCAAIATDCPSGPREIVEDGINGLVVPAENVQSLAGAIRRLMEAPDARDRLSGQGRAVAERFHPRVVAREWTGLIERLLIPRRR